MDRKTTIEDPQELAFRTTRQGLLARYFSVIPLAFLLTGFPVPGGRPAMLFAAAATLVVNAACHPNLALTRRHVPAAYISPAMDALLTSWVIYNTGMLASPFLMLLPLFPVTAFHAEFSRKRALLFTAALLVVLAIAFASWSLADGRTPAWSPAEYPAFTVYVLFLQFMALSSFAIHSLEPRPMLDAFALGQIRIEASVHRAGLGASLNAIRTGLIPPLEGVEALLARAETMLGRIPEGRREAFARPLTDYRRDIGQMRRALDGLERMQAGAGPVRKGPISAVDLLGRAAEFMRFKHAKLGRTVLYEQGSVAKVTVTCDPEEIHRALAGLMENALTRRETGRPMRIRLAAEARGTDAVLTVSDNGEPLPPGAAEAMLAEAPPQDPGDPASWLFLARRIAEEHGGAISVSSSKDGGTVFAVILPSGGEGTR